MSFYPAAKCASIGRQLTAADLPLSDTAVVMSALSRTHSDYVTVELTSLRRKLGFGGQYLIDRSESDTEDTAY